MKQRRESNVTPPPTPPHVTSVLFVPKTRGSELQRRLNGVEERLSVLGNGCVRYCEQTGVTSRQMLHGTTHGEGYPAATLAPLAHMVTKWDVYHAQVTMRLSRTALNSPPFMRQHVCLVNENVKS